MFVYMTDMFAKVGGATGGDPGVGSSPGSAGRRTKAPFFLKKRFFFGGFLVASIRQGVH